MRRFEKRIDQREQILSTSLLREDSANRLLTKITKSNVSQLELEHLRMLMWVHFLEDIVDDDVDVRTILGKGEKGIYDEALDVLCGDAGWEYNPTSN